MKKILFVVAGYDGIGLGHAYRVADLAKELPRQDVHILCTSNSRNAFDFLRESGVSDVILQGAKVPVERYVKELRPDMVVNDILNTTVDYILSLKALGVKVVSLEDQGEGAAYTDLTINAIYEEASSNHVLHGYTYFDLRDEFIKADRIGVRSNVKRVLLSFGGEDKNNLSLRFLRLLTQDSSLDHMELHVVTGPAYPFATELATYIGKAKRGNIIFTNAPTNMAYCMKNADMAIVSNGRTVYELAAIGVPSIVVSANKRELTHHFGVIAGFKNLGSHDLLSDSSFLSAVKTMLSFEARLIAHQTCRTLDLRNGKKRVVDALLSEAFQMAEA
jgi:spore coat polysaccharide biosynthesis predicted glycosyltransferase SpsG